MIVADASAAVEVLAGREPDQALALRLASEELQAPYLLDIEVFHALRGMEGRRDITTDVASRALADFEQLHVIRYPHLGFGRRIWELRHTLSAYDAAYVALAESLDAPLVTVDSRLARSRGHGATIESYARS